MESNRRATEILAFAPPHLQTDIASMNFLLWFIFHLCIILDLFIYLTSLDILFRGIPVAKDIDLNIR